MDKNLLATVVRPAAATKFPGNKAYRLVTSYPRLLTHGKLHRMDLKSGKMLPVEKISADFTDSDAAAKVGCFERISGKGIADVP